MASHPSGLILANWVDNRPRHMRLRVSLPQGATERRLERTFWRVTSRWTSAWVADSVFRLSERRSSELTSFWAVSNRSTGFQGACFGC